jgi:hypothetical protein
MAMCDDEKETIIRWSKASNEVVVYTHDIPIISKLKKLGIQPVREGKFEGTPYAEFVVDKSWIKIGKPRRRDDLRGKPVKRKTDDKE